MAPNLESFEARAVAYWRRRLDLWRTECEGLKRSGGDPKACPPIELSPILLDADCAVFCELVYAPVWPQGCTLGEDDLVCVTVFVDPLDLRVATCKLPDGTVVRLVAEPEDYTDGLTLEDHIVFLERDGMNAILDLSIEAHLQKRDAERRAATMP